jgi:hypothetical protein
LCNLENGLRNSIVLDPTHELAAKKLDPEGQTHILNKPLLFWGELPADGLHAKPAKRFTEIRHLDATAPLEDKDINDSAIGIQERRSHANPLLRRRAAFKKRRGCGPQARAEFFGIHNGSSS